MYKQLRFLTTMLLLAVCCGTWADTYKLVTSASELSQGDIIVIANASSGTNGRLMVMGSQSGNNCPAKEAYITDDIINDLQDGQEVTLESVNTDGQFSFKVGSSSYLYAASSSSNYLKTQSTEAYWSIAINSTSYAATIKDETSGKTRNLLRYNSQSKLFSCYGSGQDNVYIFKKQVTSNLDPSDLALANAPVSLNFDLYNNNTPQVINYTTSSTGEVSVVNSDYASFVVNQTAKTITVTPIAVTNGAQTITVNQAADETYAAGSATFTLNITDSTPFNGVATFVAGTDVGTSTATGNTDKISKHGITISSTNAAFATAQYRMYKSSQTTVSISEGLISEGYIIKRIVFTGEDSDNPISGFQNPSTGAWNPKESLTGTWEGEATSVMFTAGAQVRATQIVVTIEKPKTLSSIAITTPPTKVTYTEGETFDPTGMVVTATYTDETTAAVTGYTFTPDGALATTDTQVTISYTLSDVTKTATQAITVNALPAYTVTLSDDNTELVETAGGAGVTLPSRDAIGDYTFAGWSETNVTAETTTAPMIVVAGTYHPTADVTLYPVYTRSEGSTTTNTATVSISYYATAHNWSNGTAYQPLVMDENVSIGGEVSGNNFKYYSSDNSWRFYSGGSFTVSTTATALNTVKLTFSEGTLSYNDNNVTSNTAVTVSGTSATFEASATTKITAIEVTYTAGSTTTYYWSNPGATVSISSAGLATFCSEYALDFTGVADVWAYIAKYENDKVTYQRVKKVPANTGVLLRNKLEEAAISCVVPFLAINADDVTGNKFIGTLTDIAALASVDGTNTNYILNDGANGVGFYKANGKKVGAGKAYLQLPTEGAKTFIGFEEEGEATGISTIDNGQLTMENAYNLQGQKVGSEYKGIVIVNGKKVMVK